MARESTKKKQEVVIREFQKLLRSGKDYSTTSMYSEASEKVRNMISPKTVGNIIRDYYRNEITDEMQEFVSEINGMQHEQKVEYFAQTFSVCVRESRLMLRYIN